MKSTGKLLRFPVRYPECRERWPDLESLSPEMREFLRQRFVPEGKTNVTPISRGSHGSANGYRASRDL